MNNRRYSQVHSSKIRFTTRQFCIRLLMSCCSCSLFLMLCLLLTEHNLRPVASAGPDRTIWLPVDSVTLDGSNSTDDQHIDSYQWTCESCRSCLSTTLSCVLSFACCNAISSHSYSVSKSASLSSSSFILLINF